MKDILRLLTRSETWFLLMIADKVAPDGSLRKINGRYLDVQDLSELLHRSDVSINRILKLLSKKGIIKREKLPHSTEDKRAIIINRNALSELMTAKKRNF